MASELQQVADTVADGVSGIDATPNNATQVFCMLSEKG